MSALHLKYEPISDVRVHFIFVTSSEKCGGVYLTAYLGMSSEDVNSLQNLLLLHSRSFHITYERCNKNGCFNCERERGIERSHRNGNISVI